MKTDREMLELAAKAAGELTPSWYGNSAYMDGVLSRWNPLTDDGDALRLAVKLMLFDRRIVFELRLEETRANPRRTDEEIMRRAIVRAAAAIGETL